MKDLQTLLNNKAIVFVFLFYVFSTSSCSHYYYTPDDGHLTGLKDRNDLVVAVSTEKILPNSIKNSTSVQAGYSPVKYIGLTGNYFKVYENSNNNSLNSGNGNIISGAIGGYYFFSFKNLKNRRFKLLKDHKFQMKKGFLLDLYFGGGKGIVNNFYEEGGISILNFHKKYVQFGFHLFSRHWGLSYSARLGRLHYHDGNIYGNIDESSFNQLRTLESSNNFLIREFSFRIHFGIRHVRLFLNYSALAETQELINLGVVNDRISTGVNLEIDEFFRKSKKTKTKTNVEF